MASARIERLVAVLFLCLAVAQFLIQVSLLTNGIEYIASTLTNDDTYYYLQTAWQTKQSGFVTFDGMHATNGVQLLWFWIVFLLSLASNAKADLLHASLVTCFALNVLCYVPIWRFAKVLKRPGMALLMGGLWAALVADGTYWLGLENSLHAFVFWCVVWQAAEFLDRLHAGRQVSILPLTVVLVLNAWTRLDSAVFSAVVYLMSVAALLRGPKRTIGIRHGRGSRIGVSLLVGGVGTVVALVAFHLMGGSVLPVSALIKLSRVGQSGPVLDSLRRVLVSSFPDVLPHGIATPLVKLFAALASLGLVVVALGRRLFESHRLRTLRSVWIQLAVAFVVYQVVVLGPGAGGHAYFVWYRSPLFVFWIITLSAAVFVIAAAAGRSISSVAGRVGSRSRSRSGGMARDITGPAMASLGAVFIALSVFRLLTPSGIDPASMLYIRYHAANWMADNLAQESTCAAWNAGQLGFYAPQAVINLDGLANSAEYYDQVLKGQRPLMDYILENDVSYIVDYVENDLTAGLETIHAFPADALGGRLRVRRVSVARPQLVVR